MTVRVLEVMGRSAGGIATHVAQVTAALDGRDGISIDVVCPPDTRIPMPKPCIELTIPDGLGGHGAAVRRLRSIVRSNGYDLVHAHGLRAGVDAAIASKGSCACVVTVHNLVQREIAGRRARVDRLAEPVVVHLADRTLAVSQEIATRLKRAAPLRAGKIEVLYLGVGDAPEVRRDRAAVRAELGIEAGRCLLVAVARLAPQKALHVLIEAVGRMSASPMLAILGEGPLEAELRTLVASKGLAERVRFLGFRSDVADLVAAADVFCLSSIWEGVPLSVQESILLGTPVVSTDVGGMSEIVVDRQSGRLVAKGDVAALTAALEEVCASEEVRSRYSQRALADLRDRFSTDAMLRRLRELYLGGPS